MLSLMPDLTPLQTEGLAEKLLWEKPERRDQAGSILIFGGASLKLKTVDLIYKTVQKLGARPTVLVPESLAVSFKLKAPVLQPIRFDNYFGLTEQGQKTLATELALADALVLADSGKNSSTTKHLAALTSFSFKPIVITEGSLNLILEYHYELLQNPNITIILNSAALQKFQRIIPQKLEFPISLSSGAAARLNSLLELQSIYQSRVILFEDNLILAIDSASSQYLLQKTKLNLEQFSASLVCWQVWAPKAKPLQQVFMASSQTQNQT